jgi:hypothetical protein
MDRCQHVFQDGQRLVAFLVVDVLPGVGAAGEAVDQVADAVDGLDVVHEDRRQVAAVGQALDHLLPDIERPRPVGLIAGGGFELGEVVGDPPQLVKHVLDGLRLHRFGPGLPAHRCLPDIVGEGDAGLDGTLLDGALLGAGQTDAGDNVAAVLGGFGSASCHAGASPFNGPGRGDSGCRDSPSLEAARPNGEARWRRLRTRQGVECGACWAKNNAVGRPRQGRAEGLAAGRASGIFVDQHPSCLPPELTSYLFLMQRRTRQSAIQADITDN